MADTEGEGFTREELAAFLATAPAGLQDWATEQLARFDDDGADLADLLPEHEDLEGSQETAARPPGPSRLERRTGVSRLNLVLVTLLAAAVVIIIQQAGRPQPQPMGQATGVMPSNHPPIDASALAEMDRAQQLDREREAELKSQAEADPTNFEARLELSTLYYNAALYQEVIPPLQQILDQDPNHIDALIGIGAAEYRTNQYDAAEQHWLRVTEIDPQRQEPWYSLGFLYMARTPSEPERARQAWGRVVEIDPNSRMAQEVSEHLNRIATPTATAAPSSEG